MPIIVNTFEITDDDVHAEMQHHPSDTVDGARHKAAQALVIRQLLLQEASRLKMFDIDVENSNEVEEQVIDDLLGQEVPVPKLDDEICARYYEQNKERFLDEKTGDQLPLDAVSPLISEYLQARSLQTGISQYLKLLAGGAKIAGFEMEASDSPLVQ